MSRKSHGISTMLQILMAAYLIILGIQGIAQYNSNSTEFANFLNNLMGKNSNPFNLIFAIVELAAGIALVVTLFVPDTMQLAFFLNLAVALVWIVKIVMSSFIGGITMTGDKIAFHPNFITWLSVLVTDLILLINIWLVAKKQD